MVTPEPGPFIPAKMREKHDTIVSLIERFCREHLNDEYLVLCRRLAGAARPQAAVANGQRQGGGVGLWHHADHRLGQLPP
jgi:hypothetical protein